MKNVILFISVFSVNLFFVISNIVGYEYQGANTSGIYKLYNVLIFIAVFGILINSLIRKKISLYIKDVILLLIPVFLFFNLLITKFLYGYISIFSKEYYFLYFILWSYTAILAGIYLVRSCELYKIYKYIDILNIIITISIAMATINQIKTTSNFVGIGGATYQTLSYLSAFAYGLNFYMIVEGNKFERYKYFKSNIYKIISIIALLIQIISVLVSGGRGGIILVAVYTIYIIFNCLEFKNFKGILNISVIMILLLLFIKFVVPILMQNDIFKNGFERVFAFLSPEGSINWEGTSGRDIVYIDAVNIIKDNFLIGIGFFRMNGYSHNMILDILIGGGIIYFLGIINLAIYVMKKIKKIIKLDSRNKLLVIIILYPITMLMFSGSYTVSTELWFCLAVIISIRIKGKKNNEKNNICSI